jgi:hypothetical protein
MLGEWVDRLKRLVGPRAVPVREEFVATERSPVGDERLGSRRE